MTWVKLDDKFPRHPKVRPLSDRVFRLFVLAVCYCAEHDTDGELGAAALLELRPRQKDLDELIRARLLDRDEDGTLWVHDYLKYHPSRAQVKARRDGVAERVQGHRNRKQRNTVTGALQGGDDSSGNGVTGTPGNAVTNADVTAGGARARAGRDPTDPLLVSNSRENLSERDPDPDPTCQDLPSARATDAQSVFEHWQVVHGHKSSKLDRKRRARIEARLREKFTVDRLCRAISNAKNDRFLMGENEYGRIYDGIDTLLRDASQVERLEALTERPSGTQRSAGKPPGAAAHETRTAERSMDSPPAFRAAGELQQLDAQAAMDALRAVRGNHG